MSSGKSKSDSSALTVLEETIQFEAKLNKGIVMLIIVTK